MNIILQDLSLSIVQAGTRLCIIEDANLVFPQKTMALIGESRLAVAAVMDLLCRRLMPQRGVVHFNGTISWPIGRTSVFSVTITGTQAISHFSVIYGFDRNQGLAFMKSEFAAPDLITKPMSTWSTALRMQFGMLLALIPDFDIYILDVSLIMPDDVVFTRRFLELYKLRCQGKTTLITARQTKVLTALCDGAIVVANRKIYREDSLDAALAVSNKIVLEGGLEAENADIVDDGFLL